MNSKLPDDNLKLAAQEIVDSSSFKEILKKYNINRSELRVKFDLTCKSKQASIVDKPKRLGDKNPQASYCIICYYNEQSQYVCILVDPC